MIFQGVDQLEGKHALRFQEVEDDLDELKLALLETPNRHQFALTQHRVDTHSTSAMTYLPKPGRLKADARIDSTTAKVTKSRRKLTDG